MRANIRGGFLTLALAAVLAFGMAVPACATETDQNTSSEEEEEELTPEQAALKEELDQAYQMEVQSNGWTDWPQGPGTYGEAAIVMDVGTGAILYAKNIDDHHYPASITKVLTALVALQNGNLTDTVTFSHDSIAFLKSDESSIGMKEGNQISLEQALYATLLASANEVAYAVGENVGINAGHDYAWFVEQMNAVCQELGGKNSHFVNTNGLHDPEHYTCARDMALIGRELFKYPDFFRIAQTPQYTIPASPTTEEHVFGQHHQMLLQNEAEYYPFAIGGKTGYTSDALSTLITMADNGTTQLVCVVLKTHGVNVYPDTRNLLEYGFNNFQKIPVAEHETSEEIEKILDSEGGYVLLPIGATFEDLEMEMIPDGGTSSEATLNYYFGDQLVGTARAELSASYIEEHSAQPQDVSTEKAEETKDDPELLSRVILGAAVVLLVILIGLFIRITRKRKKRRRRRR